MLFKIITKIISICFTPTIFMHNIEYIHNVQHTNHCKSLLLTSLCYLQWNIFPFFTKYRFYRKNATSPLFSLHIKFAVNVTRLQISAIVLVPWTFLGPVHFQEMALTVSMIQSTFDVILSYNRGLSTPVFEQAILQFVTPIKDHLLLLGNWQTIGLPANSSSWKWQFILNVKSI